MTYLLICLMQLISIHVPTRGTTALLKQNGFKIKFQSTFPRGERHYDGLDIITANIFQSTFPRGERPWRYTVRRSTKRFQSTFPRGERPICPPEGDAGTGNFNPRSHEGNDCKNTQFFFSHSSSIHTFQQKCKLLSK